MDENEIVYMALSNQVILYTEAKKLIENNEKVTPEDQEELMMMDYIINRSLEILDSYADKIKQEDDKPIPKPKWK